MMKEYKKSTDEIQSITLESQITHALWRSSLAFVEETIPLEVLTHFVGNGSKIEVKVEDKKGKKVGEIKGEVYGNYFGGTVIVPKKAREEITFTAKLPDHGIELKSDPVVVIPLFEVTNQKWGQKEARRGDVVKLTADVKEAPDGLEYMIYIYEYDQDSAHDFITKFPCRVKDQNLEAEWEYEYHEDTDEIPTEEEKKKYGGKYNPPEYFWVAELGGKRFGDDQESGLLEFKDWLIIELYDDENNLIPNEKFIIHLPDGTKKKGSLNSKGFSKLEDLPPGKVEIEYPESDAEHYLGEENNND